MFPGSLPYAVPLILAAALNGGLALYAFRRREPVGSATLGGLLLAVTAWCTASANEYLALTIEGKILAAKFEYLAMAGVPPLWLAFALRYTQRAHWLTRRNQLLLALSGLAIAALVLTNEWHHLVWARVGIDAAISPALIIYERGAAGWLYMAFAYGLTLAGVMLYLVTFARAPRIYRIQIGIMVFASLLPVLASVFYYAGPWPFRGLDFTPFAFGVSGTLLAVGLFRYNLLDLSPIAAQVIIDHLQDAVLVLDARNRLIGLNPAAMKLFNVGEEAIGQNVLAILHPAASFRAYVDVAEVHTEIELGEGEERRWYELIISPLHNRFCATAMRYQPEPRWSESGLKSAVSAAHAASAP